MNNIEAAIFDLDGTLVDSMWVWEQIDIDYLSKFGHAVPSNLVDEITHLSFSETANYFKTRFELEDTIENIMCSWSDMAFNYYSNVVKLKPGALEYLNKLKNSNIKIALATSNSRPLLETVLKNNGIYDLFDCITTTDEVARNKNYPDIYLHSAEKLNVAPENCIVFEDVIAAVIGAKAADMTVVAVYDKHSEHQSELLQTTADKYIADYFQLI